MSVRRINSTGRLRIVREDAKFSVRPDSDGTLIFDAELTLHEYDLPPDAPVFVEAYRQTTFMRFPFGTVTNPRLPTESARRLSEFQGPEGLLFRVKVTATGDRSGVLLAEADRIPLVDDEEQPQNRIPLLPPRPGDTGQELWQVDCTSEAGPQLVINRNVADWKETASSPLFRALVFPAAMREVLWQVYAEQDTDPDDQNNWRSRWLKFAASLPGVGEPPAADADLTDWRYWIDCVAEAFAGQHGLLSQYKHAVQETQA